MRIRIKCVTLIFACLVSLGARAQSEEFNVEGSEPAVEQGHVKLFGHLDIGISLGTTGIGINLTSHINRTLRLRAGFSYMPHFKATTDFSVRSGNYNADGEWDSQNIDRFIEYLEEATGYRVDDSVDMRMKPRMNNFSLLLDIYPFHKKNWYATVGFYIGGSTLGTAINTTEEMTALVSVGFYNAIYEKVINDEPIFRDYYLDPEICDRIIEYGRMGIHVGDYVDGSGAYVMETDDKNMVSATAKVDKFKPYVGIGYTGRLVKGDDRFGIGFDCGVMTWGGTPEIYTHDGTNLSKDVTDIDGKVGRYVRAIKHVKAYPVVNLRLTRKIF